MQLTRILHNCTTTLWIWCVCSLSAATVSAQLTFARGCPYSEACADHQLPHLALPTPCLHPWAFMSHIMENPWKSATREANAKPIQDMIFQKVRLILRPNKSLSQAPVSRSNVKSCSFGMLIKKCSTLLFWFRIIFFRSKHLKDLIILTCFNEKDIQKYHREEWNESGWVLPCAVQVSPCKKWKAPPRTKSEGSLGSCRLDITKVKGQATHKENHKFSMTAKVSDSNPERLFMNVYDTTAYNCLHHPETTALHLTWNLPMS